MRERYERDEYSGRRPGTGEIGRRRDERRDRLEGGAGDAPGRAVYREDTERYDEAGRSERHADEPEDWGDVQVGRWGRRQAVPRDETSRRDEPPPWGRDESYWGGTTGKWSRDSDREPSVGRGFGVDSRRWQPGMPDADRDWQSSPGSRGAGRFAGVGPKSYQRSDDRIREDVCDRLTADAWVDPSDVAIRVKDGDVTLEGTVDGHETKRRVEDLVEEVAGVRQVHDFLQVRSSRGAQAPSGSSTGANQT
jgi:hypothetical protein